MLNGLDLFSGGGGLAEGLHRWVRPVAYCEIEPGAQRVLLSRMARGELPLAPIWDDVRTLRGSMLPELDAIIGGFPCQDISSAGARAGLEGKRSGLVFEYLSLIGECRPRFVFMENVAALTVRGLDRVLLGLDALGYDARWTIVSAAEVGADHYRERTWILAHTDSDRGRKQSECKSRRKDQTDTFHYGEKESLAHNPGQPGQPGQPGRLSIGSEAKDALSRIKSEYGGRNREWPPEPSVGRVAHGVADRVNRIRILGNGVVPACAEKAFAWLDGIA